MNYILVFEKGFQIGFQWVNSFVLLKEFDCLFNYRFFFLGCLFNELYFFLMYHIILYIVVHVIYSIAFPCITRVSD